MTRILRLVAAVAIGGALATLGERANAAGAGCHDVDIFLTAARAVAHGVDPYAAVAAAYPVPFYYPMPAAVALAPLGILPLGLARVLFVGGSAAALAYGLLERGRWGALLMVSVSVTFAAVCGQWATVLTAGALVPWASALWIVKPTLGLALFVAYPRRWAVIGGLALVALSFAVNPHWVGTWLEAVRGAPQYLAPVQRPFGWLLLLGWLRWRSPGGRLLGMLALMPHTTFFPDSTLLVLIPRTGRRAYIWTALGMVVAALILPQTGESVPAELAREWPYLLAGVYLPALVLELLPQRTVSH